MHPILANILNQKTLPLAMEESVASEFLSILNKNIDSAELKTEEGRDDAFASALATSFGVRKERQLYNTHQDAAVIPIHGMLINRFNSTWGWITGYNYIKSAITAALEDNTVERIILDVNSNGGMVAGCFETAEIIREAKEIKPITAIVDASCYSAAYALASAASEIIATPSAGVGSIGVVAIHASHEKMLENWGVEVTFLKAGAKKVLGNSYKNLTDEDKAELQKSIDFAYETFVSFVSAARGVDASEIRATEAACFAAQQALDAKLIDDIQPVEKAIFGLSKKGNTMNNEEERGRIKAIIGFANSALAHHLAFETDMSADAAIAVLTAAKADEDKKAKEKADEDKKAKEKADEDETEDAKAKDKKADKSALDVAMEIVGSPNVGADNAQTNEAAANIAGAADFANSFEV